MKALGTILLTVVVANSAFAAKDRPNVVLFISDDHGWPYFSFADSPEVVDTNVGPIPVADLSRTPNVESLAEGGALFRAGYTTASVCVPTLDTLISAGGLDPILQWSPLAQVVATRFGTPYRSESRFMWTLPRVLAAAGYVSWEGGKFWSGQYPDPGFDDGMATRQPQGLFDLPGGTFLRDGWDPAVCGSTGDPDVPCPALDPLREFLDSIADAPFFLWVAPQLPHTPWDSPAEYRAEFEALGIETFKADYLANVRWLDETLGELVRELENRGIRDDTLIIFMSDNGWRLGEVWPGVRGKESQHDLGFRTPIIFNYPGGIPPGEYPDLVSISDIHPTVYDYVGAEHPRREEGLSLKVRMEGGPPLARTHLVTHHIGDSVVTSDGWRYMDRDDTGVEELYDLDTDPFETVNLAAAHPDLVAELREIADSHKVALLTPEEQTIRLQVYDQFGEPAVGSALRARTVDKAKMSNLVGTGGVVLLPPVELDLDYAVRHGSRLGRLVWRSTGSDYGGPTKLVDLLARDVYFNPVQGARWKDVGVPFESSLVGIVTDADTGDPVEGAQVRVMASVERTGIRAETPTLADGSYHVPNLPVDDGYRMIVKRKGYRRSVQVVEIASVGETAVVDFQLQPK